MVLVPRRVRRAHEPRGLPADDSPVALETLRDRGAWVLLGEPGAGKSKAFEHEAEATGGRYLHVTEFLHDDMDDEWYGKTLFLDGLDEVRAGSDDRRILLQVRTRLRRLGKPRFRIACRSADWFGASDREDIAGASPDGTLATLLLEPLGEDDMLVILRENHCIADPDAFIKQARQRGVHNLLDNPQTLGMLTEAVQGRHGQWPSTREETFQLACEKLARERNKRHRDSQRNRPTSTDGLLDAAGQLCAALLLADKIGVALDSDQADERFPCLDNYAPPESDAAHEAVRTRLFRPDVGEERFVPVHRSVAEYLAARWLAARVDGDGLPLGRVLNLMLGADGRTVAGLRGLYGWLALHCGRARTRMIDADPLTVVVYGDAKPLPVEDKRRLLAGLRREAERYAAFRAEVTSSHHFGALADPDLADDFIAALESPERDEASQSFADCVLDILAQGEAIPGLAGTIKKVVLDANRWGAVRQTAFDAWLKVTDAPDEALALLDAITNSSVADPDDELAGRLLDHLYPEHIGPEILLHYLHVPKDRHLLGHFAWFWHRLPLNAPESHLAPLLDQLALRTDLPLSGSDHDYHLAQMAASLLARGVELHGEQVSDERLYDWLGIGVDEFGEIQRETRDRERIACWFEAHPNRYKSLLSICIEHCDSKEHPAYWIHLCSRRLRGAAIPENMGLWHLEQASRAANDTATRFHLSAAVEALMYQRGGKGLSLDLIEAWSENHPEKKHHLEPLLAWEIPEWRTRQAKEAKSREHQYIEQRRQRTVQVSKHIPEIRSGTANVALLHQLAGVWMGHYWDIHGESPSERFDNYCDNGPDFLAATESGLVLCPERAGLPSVDEIIDLAAKKREHYICLPCLVGMDLRWRQGPSFIDSLSDDSLRRMLAFRLTYGADSTPEWFTHLVAERPAMVAEVLVNYASAALGSKQEHVDSLYPLERDSGYREVAVRAVPELLARFPIRVRTNQLHYLKNLLHAALLYQMESLPALVENKTASKGMDVAQKVYWLAAGMLLNSSRYEPALWKYVGSSSTRANHLSGFLSTDFCSYEQGYSLSATTISRLIELSAPHAQTEWPRGGGSVTPAMQRGDHIRALITCLGSLGTEEAESAINRLLDLPSLRKLKYLLETARHELRLKRREGTFRFLPLAGVVQVLANKAPASIPDLAALVLSHLDDIAREIRQENDDGFRAFWNIKNKVPSKREENHCRDELLRRLRNHVRPVGVECQPEGDYVNDKRADLRISYRNVLDLPIEIKRDDNDKLWSALHSQLIEQYSISPRAAGHGVYVVLWFGRDDLRPAKDGGKKPRSPEELKARLEAQLDPEERRRIFVRVLDVSWPPISARK